jgi:hypothetical protein
VEARLVKKLAVAVLLMSALGAPSAGNALSIRDGSSWEPIILGWNQYLEEHQARLRDLWAGWIRDWNSRGTVNGTPSAVPEPGAALLFGLGALVVASRSRKRA